MRVNEFETKGNKIQTKDKTEPQQLYQLDNISLHIRFCFIKYGFLFLLADECDVTSLC